MTLDDFKEEIEYLWIRIKKNPWKAMQFVLSYHMHLPHWLVYPYRAWQDKKFVESFPPGTVIEDCSYHPCIIKENDNGDLTCLSLLTNTYGCCSLFHCGVIKLTAEEVEARIAAYKSRGRAGLLLLVGYTPEQIEEMKKTSNNVKNVADSLVLPKSPDTPMTEFGF